MMSGQSCETVSHDMFALLHQAAAPVVTRWTYRKDDPFAVTLTIQTRGDHRVNWILARELLVTGLTERAGIGDVQVSPAKIDDWNVVLVEIRSPDGRAVLEVDPDLLRQFVEATTRAVPLGSESSLIDMDAEIEKITKSCPG